MTNSVLKISQSILLSGRRHIALANGVDSMPQCRNPSPAISVVIRHRGQRYCEADTLDLSGDMPDGRIDTRSPRPRFPRHDTPLRSTLLHWAHCKGMVCARTSSSFDFSLTVLPSLSRLLTHCMQISKPRPRTGTRLCKVYGEHDEETNCLVSKSG